MATPRPKIGLTDDVDGGKAFKDKDCPSAYRVKKKKFKTKKHHKRSKEPLNLVLRKTGVESYCIASTSTTSNTSSVTVSNLQTKEDAQPHKANAEIAVEEPIKADVILRKLQIFRSQIGRLVGLPKGILENITKGSFVRLRVAQEQYYVAEVTGLEEAALPYAFEKTQITIALKVAMLGQEFKVGFDVVSNLSIADSEILEWLSNCKEYNVPLPTPDFADSKTKVLQCVLNGFVA